MMLTGGNNLDGQTRTKDSIDNQDITVMDTKLKILEILQVWLYSHIFFKASVISSPNLSNWFC